MKKINQYTAIGVLIGLALATFFVTERQPDMRIQIGPDPTSTLPDASVVESVSAGCVVGRKCSTPNSYCFTQAGDHSSPKLACAKVGNDWQWQSK